MPAKSQAQQKFFATALSVKRGDTPRNKVSKEILDVVDSMSEKDIRDYAKTDTSKLPVKTEAILRNYIKKLLKEELKQLQENDILSYKEISPDKYAEVVIKGGGLLDNYVVEFKNRKITDNIYKEIWNKEKKQREYKKIDKSEIDSSTLKKIIKLAQEEYESNNYEQVDVDKYTKTITDLTDIKPGDAILYRAHPNTMNSTGIVDSIKGNSIVVKSEYMGKKMMKIKHNINDIEIKAIKRNPSFIKEEEIREFDTISQLMPIADKYGLTDILHTLLQFYTKNNEKIAAKLVKQWLNIAAKTF